MKSTKKRRRKHITNAFFRSSMEVSHLILFMPRRNDLQEKKNQLQCNNHVDPKKIAFSLIKLIGICIGGSNSVFQNDNLEMSLGGDAYTSEF